MFWYAITAMLEGIFGNKTAEKVLLHIFHYGRSRVYSFNPKSTLMEPVKDLVEIVYESIPLPERQKLFEVRRRPRQKGKPIR